MKPTMEILARIKQNSERNKDEIFTRLYRYLLRPDIYYVAYSHLYANNGAATNGIVNDTADGFSERKIVRIIQSLTDGTYQPAPVRRTYIEKKMVKSVRWVSLHSQISWYKKLCGWCWNRCMSRYSWIALTGFGQTGAAIRL